MVVVVVGPFCGGGDGDDGRGGTGFEGLRLKKGLMGVVVGLVAGGLITRWNV